MIDTHTHLQFQAFDEIRDQVIKNSQTSGVEKMIVVGTNVQTSKDAIGLAKEYDCLYAAVGIHPHHVYKYIESGVESLVSRLDKDIKEVEKLLMNPKVLAVGEVGMDQHIYGKTKYTSYQVTKEFTELQKKAFAAQIKLAIKYNKSLIIHNISAADLLLEIFEKNWDKKLEGRSVFHCCEPDQRLLEFALKHHVFIGIDGDITEYPAKQEFIKKIPLDLLVLETDSPFLAPVGKDFPNTPVNLNYILDFIASRLRIKTEKLDKTARENSKLLFRI